MAKRRPKSNMLNLKTRGISAPQAMFEKIDEIAGRGNRSQFCRQIFEAWLQDHLSLEGYELYRRSAYSRKEGLPITALDLECLLIVRNDHE
jgi:hypothetical protein